MLERTDFEKKQIVVMFSSQGEKVSFRNDNIVIKDKDGKIKYQITCYRVFSLMIVGEVSVTSGLIQRAKRFGFTIVLFTRGFRIYSVIGNRMEGNTLLHKKQYEYSGDDLAKYIVVNKVKNQKAALNKIRDKNVANKEAIQLLDSYIAKLQKEKIIKESLLGIEGSASRVYFPQIFNNTKWIGRRPRIKSDWVNATLDIGYTVLFNITDALLQLYGFDVYCGIYHKEYYMRKSLVCDMMEPMRPVIDWTVRKSINLKQFQEDDFEKYNDQFVLKYKCSPKYIQVFVEAVLEYKNEMFLFVQGYYRSFMKERNIEEYQEFEF